MAKRDGFQMDERFKRSMKGKFGRFNLRAGVLQDKPHREPRSPKEVMASRKKPEVFGPKFQKPQKFGPKQQKKKSKKQLIKAKIKKAQAKVKKKIKNRLMTAEAKKRKRVKAMTKSNRARGLGTMEGGPVRLKKATTRGTVMKIAHYIRTRHKIPYLTAPFRNAKSKEIKTLTRELISLIAGKTKSYSKTETALRAAIRVPFLRKKYGRNSRAAQRIKTFDRLGIDTGQFFRALDGKVRVNNNVPK